MTQNSVETSNPKSIQICCLLILFFGLSFELKKSHVLNLLEKKKLSNKEIF